MYTILPIISLIRLIMHLVLFEQSNCIDRTFLLLEEFEDTKGETRICKYKVTDQSTGFLDNFFVLKSH